jgi:hypothetical protein
MPLGSAFGLVVVDIGGKRHSAAIDGAIVLVFSLFHSVTNTGALLVGWTVEILRDIVGTELHHGSHMSAERMTIFVAAAATAAVGIAAYTLVVEGSPSSAPKRHDEPPARSLRETVMMVVRDTSFWKLLLFRSLFIGIALESRSIDAMFPKAVLRTLGSSAHYGALYSIVPMLTIPASPLLALFTLQFDIYNVVLVGTLIAALSILLLAIDVSQLFIVLYSIVFTVGEATYVSQTIVYIMSVAPEGREGLYVSLVYAPTFVSKIIVGPMSAWLLDNYCSHTSPFSLVENQCRLMWPYVGAAALTTPVLLYLARSRIHTEDVATRANAAKRAHRERSVIAV